MLLDKGTAGVVTKALVLVSIAGWVFINVSVLAASSIAGDMFVVTISPVIVTMSNMLIVVVTASGTLVVSEASVGA